MDRVKRWFSNWKLGSMESLNMQSAQDHAHIAPPEANQTDYEITSIKIKQLLEKQQYARVVETLRELPREYVLNCLESFPFIELNRAVPTSFLIWETLLTKLHNSEEGYIPQFPYKACDELMMSIAWLMENSQEEELTHSCKRVIKCVYMQYNEVLDHLFKEQGRVEHALYTLGLHSPAPLAKDSHTPLTIKAAIKEEVEACLEDYTTALERLEDFQREEVVSLTDVLKEGQVTSQVAPGESAEGDPIPMEVHMASPSPTQVQLHERLYQNQQVLTALQPSRRSGSLKHLLKQLNERIRGDKEVIFIFARVRDRDPVVTDSVPVQPYLRRYQHALELVIGTLKDIEKDLEIIPRVDSPMQLSSRDSAPSSGEEAPQIVPNSIRPRSSSYEHFRGMTAALHRHSVTPILATCDDDKVTMAKTSPPRRNLSVPHTHRPRSASPQKFLRILKGSMKSVSSTDSSINLETGGGSASAHDLHSITDPPSLPFTRVQSLKSPHSVQVVAGKRTKGMTISPNSYTNLTSRSMGNVNGHSLGGGVGGGAKKLRRGSLQKSESEDLWDGRQMNGTDEMIEDAYLLQHLLETTRNELNAAHRANQELRKRERELTDRLSEQAQKHLQGSEKFEDILLGSNRPTLVIQRYNELFSEGRMEALDSFDAVTQEIIAQKTSIKQRKLPDRDFSSQVLLEVLKLSYDEATCFLQKLHSQWRDSLGISTDDKESAAVRQLEAAVSLYLRKMSSKQDVSNIIQNVKVQLSLKYSDSLVFHKASKTEAFSAYVKDCAQVSWELCVQTPPMVIDYSETEFNVDLHTRFYESDVNSNTILLYHWPTLMLTSSRPISRGHVKT